MITYKEFIKAIKDEEFPGTYTLKDDRYKKSYDDSENSIELKNILKDIILPKFYHDIAEL
jgi:hypothetical protein